MSKVRMCDRCGGIFSEKDQNWSSGKMTVNRKYDDGSPYTEEIQQDFCRECAQGFKENAPMVPMIKLPGETAAQLPRQ